MNKQPTQKSKRDIYLTEVEPAVLGILKRCAENGIPAQFSCTTNEPVENGVRSKFHLSAEMFGGQYPY